MFLNTRGHWDWQAYYTHHGIVPPAPRTDAEREAERVASEAALAERLGRKWGMEPGAALRRYERTRERYWRD